MSRKQAVRTRPGRKAELERKRDERAARRALAKERKNRAGEVSDPEEFVSFTNQLQVLGLRLREVPGDGNCLFRALDDQLEGHSRNHLKHRRETVDYMVKHRDDFEPFVEDDVPFDRHVENLAKPGTFAGNDAIVAFARNNQVNVVIHQLNNPLWQIRGTDKANIRELHIAYRYGEHYDSVRHINDNTEMPANLQTEMLSKDKSIQKSRQRSQLADEQAGLHGDAVQKVCNATGCADVRLIMQSLKAESYDIESTIHAVLQIEELKLIDSECDPVGDTIEFPHFPNSWEVEENVHSGFSGDKHFELSNQFTCDQRNKKGPTDEESEEQQENNANKGQVKLGNKQKKEQLRQQKKKRQEERHRQKVLESRGNIPDANNRDGSSTDAGEVTVVKALAALSI